MKTPPPSELTDHIGERAKGLGASVAGVADVEALKASPSHRIAPRIGLDLRARWREAPDDVSPAEVDWPADAVSALVIGASHPADRPELENAEILALVDALGSTEGAPAPVV